LRSVGLQKQDEASKAREEFHVSRLTTVNMLQQDQTNKMKQVRVHFMCLIGFNMIQV
jgi:hypothetical protein